MKHNKIIINCRGKSMSLKSRTDYAQALREFMI